MPKSLLQRIFLTALVIVAAFPLTVAQTSRRTRVAVLDFGDTQTGLRVTDKLVQAISLGGEFQVIDRDQAGAAVRGTDYRGSLNMSVEDARDLGAAIGCDFFFTGEAQTLRRSSSETPAYFETYAAVYLVSARTGRLASWHRLSVKRPQPTEAEKALLDELAAQGFIDGEKQSMRRAVDEERAERAHAIESGAPVIEVMSEDKVDNQTGTRPPRPYRRLKPAYPETAALSEVEATVDILVDVDEKGEVSRVDIARWAGYGLDESVLTTVKQLHFFPAMRNGRAIPMRVLLRYNFRKPTENSSR